jgi:hypothetical protein
LLPDESKFEYRGPDWILHLLGTAETDERNNIMLLLWRAWHHRNDIMYGKGKCSIRGSVESLTNYYALSLNLAGQANPQGISDKGKEKVQEGVVRNRAVGKEGGKLVASR